MIEVFLAWAFIIGITLLVVTGIYSDLKNGGCLGFLVLMLVAFAVLFLGLVWAVNVVTQ
jgi:hypothetical protein